MFLSRTVRYYIPTLSGMMVVAAAFLLSVQSARAQQAPSGPKIPLDAKGFQAAMIRQEYLQHRYAQRPAATARISAPSVVLRPATPANSFQVVVSVPGSQPATASTPAYADIRGPDGQVRRFTLAGGVDVIQRPQIIVRPGESATIHFVAAAPGK